MKNDLTKRSYALITPANNEEYNIEKTIQAVISQTVLPRKWVIVSDGSTDGTDNIVKKYAKQYTLIEFIRISDHDETSFGSKARAINIGYQRLEGVEYDFIGNLDADITFAPDYYQRVLMKFEENVYDRLGIAGGMIAELWNGRFTVLDYNVNSVAGAIQMFRKRCYEEIGGYRPLKLGGIDALAEILSRMRGWEVKSFKDIIAYHHRRIGTTRGSLTRSRFRYGLKDYSIGTHPMFMFLKCVHRFKEKPFIAGGILMLCGYFMAWIRRDPKAVSEEIAQFVRREQIDRMKAKIPF
jgi:poly-beta-1,6-N-acetyl-D-glucosamine synthase